MNPESRYAGADLQYVVSHTYDETGEVEINHDTEAPEVVPRRALYRYTTLPLPDPPERSTRAKVTDSFQLFAKSEYNDPQKWWLIADANPQIRHPLDLSPGDTVFIP